MEQLAVKDETSSGLLILRQGRKLLTGCALKNFVVSGLPTENGAQQLKNCSQAKSGLWVSFSAWWLDWVYSLALLFV